MVTVDIQDNVPCEDGVSVHRVVTYNHSWQEIYDALLAGRSAYVTANIADEEAVSVLLEPITEATHELIPDEYIVRTNASSYFFSDANSLVFESECSDK